MLSRVMGASLCHPQLQIPTISKLMHLTRGKMCLLMVLVRPSQSLVATDIHILFLQSNVSDSRLTSRLIQGSFSGNILESSRWTHTESQYIGLLWRQFLSVTTHPYSYREIYDNHSTSQLLHPFVASSPIAVINQIVKTKATLPLPKALLSDTQNHQTLQPVPTISFFHASSSKSDIPKGNTSKHISRASTALPYPT